MPIADHTAWQYDMYDRLKMDTEAELVYDLIDFFHSLKSRKSFV